MHSNIYTHNKVVIVCENNLYFIQLRPLEKWLTIGAAISEIDKLKSCEFDELLKKQNEKNLLNDCKTK